jgi:hypothetical protein
MLGLNFGKMLVYLQGQLFSFKKFKGADMKRTILFFALFAFAAAGTPVWAQQRQCTLSGWVEDKDKNGTNVRETPSVKGRIVTTFPFPVDEDHQVIVEVTGFSAGWLKIRSAETIDGTQMLEHPAWISAKKVTATVGTNTTRPAVLYAGPSKKARRVGTIPDQTLISIAGFDCFGYKVTYKGKTGWLSSEDTCGSPVTTCP